MARDSIRIHPRLSPVASMEALVAELCPGAQAGAVEALTTEEGELASLVTVASPDCERTLGVVHGDEHDTLIDAVCGRPERFAASRDAARSLTRAHRLGLAELRPRRFRYRPPEGWRARARGVTTEWRHPSGAARVLVRSACPSGTVGGEATEGRAKAGFRRSWLETPWQVHGAPMDGGAFRMRGAYPGGPELEVLVIALEDDRFTYILELEHHPAVAEAACPGFMATVASVEPLPRRVVVRATAPATLAYWSE